MDTITILTTRRLRLRTWRESDSAAYHEHCNTPEVMKYLGGKMPLRHVRREVRWYMHDHDKHGHTFWALERKRDKALLGFCGIIRVPELDSPMLGLLEIGWRVRRDMWRRGYAHEAASAVINWAEWELPAETLYARIHQDNVASQALARKLAMRRARVMEAKQARLDAELWIFRRSL
ncbi:GNAT family N-acetyltransferase [Parafrankia sp. BMG5.11]|uniref:GNAT family N-acetyltransferase n=1 Tax=Parafrankia sp. BMG5.11 TaxID=222540 RepID=UPI00103EC231|nr:GNAT family N-acetyltransferase [Parafrankia sp. BMG5.11]TCJ41401.1 N-acetyltransferase [Parafrankia sp. BMG5.11]